MKRFLLATLLLSFGLSAQAAGLSGHWQGRYFYPDGRSNAFETDFTIKGQKLEGHMVEPREEGGGLRDSKLRGSVKGNHISFLKQYDPKSGWAHAVSYEGTYDASSGRISGNWRLPTLSGDFEMHR